MAKTRGTSKGKKNKGALTLDLSGVETSTTIPEGNYIAEVDSIEVKMSENSGNSYLAFTFIVTEGKSKKQKLFHNCSLQPQALFNLKGVLLALGFDIPEDEFELDTEALVGAQCGLEVAHEVYEGKKKARITDFINLEDADGENNEDEEDSDDLEDMDMDELKAKAKEVGVDAKAIKKAKNEKALIKLIEAEEDEDDEEEDEESAVDLESLDKPQLKELAEELEIDAKAIKKAKSKELLIALINKEDADEIEEAYTDLFGEDEDDKEDEDDDAPDYEEMSLSELKAELKERDIKLPKKASKEDIIELLEEDDEE